MYEKIIAGKLQFPDFVSERSKDMIRRILNVNPSKRPTLDEIKSHIFCKQSESSLIKILQQLNFYDYNHIKKIVLQKMIEMGHEKETIEINLDNNKHNNITTTFELFFKKQIKSENFKKTTSTFSSENPINPIVKSGRIKDSKESKDKIKNKENKDVSQINFQYESSLKNRPKKIIEEKDININIYTAKKIGNININISNPTTYYQQRIPPLGGKYRSVIHFFSR